MLQIWPDSAVGRFYFVQFCQWLGIMLLQQQMRSVTVSAVPEAAAAISGGE